MGVLHILARVSMYVLGVEGYVRVGLGRELKRTFAGRRASDILKAWLRLGDDGIWWIAGGVKSCSWVVLGFRKDRSMVVARRRPASISQRQQRQTDYT